MLVSDGSDAVLIRYLLNYFLRECGACIVLVIYLCQYSRTVRNVVI